MKKFLIFTVTNTGSKVMLGLDNIAWIKVVSGTVMEIYYTGSATLKTTITFTTSDTTYSAHYAVMQAISDSLISANQPSGAYPVPPLPLNNTITNVVYA
jgi:hypothetical protein